ncbi:recombinase RecT [Corynebacterium sanguinis]|uniref:recombinase RecT n=1 Tax=Corynebacterium sanguinis TaxID=2594913 RepID=UPI0021A69DDD|nr:recombinase RecT [Corynebacterium sanguinis]MCT1491333.1 recombinase RecT [Corynebacterium sanguinis]MCT2246748.1 recombinase RecT [Corynebacterium sanguinis]
MSNDIALQQFKNDLDVQIKHAELMSQANMIPDKFKGNPANVLVAQELAKAMGETTWVTMSELYFVGNVPTFSAKYMRSRVRAAGHILREHYDPETMTATCTIIRSDDPDYEHVVSWNKAKAIQHGLWDKGHWKKNHELMLKNRAVSECVREACNEVMGGVDYTREEAEEMAPVKMTATRKPAGSLKEALAPAPSPDEPEVDPLSKVLADIEQAEDTDSLKQIMDAAMVALDGDELDTARQVGNAKWGELNGQPS